MSQVTFLDKNKNIQDGTRNIFRDVDANELKSAVNTKQDKIEPTVYAPSSFLSSPIKTINTSKKIALITKGDKDISEQTITTPPIYTPTTVTIDVGEVPTENINVYYFN